MAKVTLRLFAGPREAVGRRDVALDVADDATVGDVLDALIERYPVLERWRSSALVSLNQEFASPEEKVGEGDELAFMPPVSGGATDRARIHEGPFSVDDVLGGLSREGAGAAVAFLGIVRDTATALRRRDADADSPQGGGKGVGSAPTTRDARVERLEFDAYAPMAEKELEAVRARAVEKFGLVDAAIRHRIGTLATGEDIVLVLVTSPHRREAFEAAMFIMDELKTVVPIWKKEVGPDGGAWVNDPTTTEE